MMIDRPHCRETDACKAAKPTTHCRSCMVLAHNANPAIRERARLSLVETLADPKERAARSRRAVIAAAKISADPAKAEARRLNGCRHGAPNIVHTHTPEARAKAGKAITASKLRHIPSEHRDEYKQMVRSGIKAAEAEQIVKNHVAAIVRRPIVAMIDREQRRKREAY